jgi:hypothetical protein
MVAGAQPVAAVFAGASVGLERHPDRLAHEPADDGGDHRLLAEQLREADLPAAGHQELERPRPPPVTLTLE